VEPAVVIVADVPLPQPASTTRATTTSNAGSKNHAFLNFIPFFLPCTFPSTLTPRV